MEVRKLDFHGRTLYVGLCKDFAFYFVGSPWRDWNREVALIYLLKRSPALTLRTDCRRTKVAKGDHLGGYFNKVGRWVGSWQVWRKIGIWCWASQV